MSTIRDFTLTKDNIPTVDVTMRNAGKPIKIKIIDKDGNPVPGYMIAMERWGKQRLVNPILLEGKQEWVSTDANGCWVWNEAPENEVVFDMMKMGNWMDIRDKGMTARDAEYVFTAAPPLEVSGTITDAETGEPLPAYKVWLGMGFDGGGDLYWDYKPNSGKDGTYLVSESFPRPRFAVKIEADGYEPAISRDIAPDEGVITINFTMQKLSAEKLASVLKGVVLTPDGQPASRAAIVLVTQTHNRQPMIYSGGNVRAEEPYVIQADADGKFQFGFFDFETEGKLPEYARQFLKDGDSVDRFALYIFDTSGFKKIGQKEWESQYINEPVLLEQWGEIQGFVKFGTRPASGILLVYQPDFGTAGWDLSPSFHYQAKSDELGNFTFRHVPPGKGLVSREVFHPGANYSTTGDNTEIHVKSGETTTITFGGEGRPVTGTLVFDEDIKENVVFSKVEIQCAPYLATPPQVMELQNKMSNMFPKEIMEETDGAKQQSLFSGWMASDAGKEYLKLQEELMEYTKEMRENMKRSRPTTVQADGTFRIENVTEGEWQLGSFILEDLDKMRGAQRNIIASLSYRFTIENIPGGVSDEPFDLGTLTLKKVEQGKPFLKVGQEAPDFELPQIVPIPEDTPDDEAQKLVENAAQLKLSDFQGKTVILEFWATWCGPCLEKLPELKRFYQTIEGDPRFVMIGISLDSDDAAEQVGRFVAKREIPWRNALAGSWDTSPMLRDYGISAIPAILLIGPDGKVLLANPSVEELLCKVKEIRE
jgi:thiol-disulfide isomerase/thioredoxin